jgi:hypothetical protein
MGTLTMPDIRWVSGWWELLPSCVVLFCFAFLFSLVELRLFSGLELLCVWHDLEIFGTYYCLLLLRAILPARGLGFEGCFLFLTLLCFAFFLTYLALLRAIGRFCRINIEDGGFDPEVRILDQDGTFGVPGSHRISCGASFGYLFSPCNFWYESFLVALVKREANCFPRKRRSLQMQSPQGRRRMVSLTHLAGSGVCL